MKSRAGFILTAAVAICFGATTPSLHADVASAFEATQAQIEELLLDSLGHRLDPQDWAALKQAETGFAGTLQSPASKALWASQVDSQREAEARGTVGLAESCGKFAAAMQHAAALEMLERQRHGDIAGAQAWRAIIALPKHANSVEGALALQRLGSNKLHQDAVGALLAREYIAWQATRVRERLDGLKRAAISGRANVELVVARMAEISTLANFPADLCALAQVPGTRAQALAESQTPLIALATKPDWPTFLQKFGEWQTRLESELPNLLTQQEIDRHGRLLVKLVRLVPKEYHNGVRDGQVVVPLEYREAKDFIVQAQQLVSELSGAWRQTQGDAFEKYSTALIAKMEATERLILGKADPAEVDRAAKEIEDVLVNRFGLSVQRAGSGKGVVEEIALEVRTGLKNSLAAAQAGRWSEAESLRVDAYTTFDTELEKRVLPRDPELGLRAERSFLDGEDHAPGIKALFDQRKKGPELEAAFARTLTAVDQCVALLKVNLSPATVIYTVLSIIAREGLEAVVVLAALLAGMRGPEQRSTRRRVVAGAWLALAATAVTFWISRTIIQSLTRYGEKLEAVISVLAVLVLLMVTNWVFHKVYWVGWNAKLRKLSKTGEPGVEGGLEWLSLVMVGFLTIYREGFETTLFLQSLILESGMKWVLIGIACGAVMVAGAGVLIFVIGARLPYRKLLVFTGVLVVTILVTFLGSTVRLFQTVGWLPIHPIPGLHVPTWAGFWLGIYPSVEGIVIPLLGFAYVIGAWLFVKIQAARRGARAMAAAREAESFSAHPALAKRPPAI
ncbi:MAG: high-affinity iron transporter [Verrucomicrobiota bacterium]|jgi:high-affinity iron transporter